VIPNPPEHPGGDATQSKDVILRPTKLQLSDCVITCRPKDL